MNTKENQQLGAPATRWRMSVAPMMDWTDRHCRYFHRLLSRHALLYTEMVTTGALIHGDVPRHLDFNRRGASRRPATRRQRAGRAGAMRAAGRGVGLRRDQPQLRLPERAGAARLLRRLPDVGAAAGGRLRQGHVRCRRDSGHGEAPHRHRQGRELRIRARLRRRGERGRLQGFPGPCTQRLAQGPVAEGKPRGAAAALRVRPPAQARLPRADHCRQRRHHHRRADGRRNWSTSMA